MNVQVFIVFLVLLIPSSSIYGQLNSVPKIDRSQIDYSYRDYLNIAIDSRSSFENENTIWTAPQADAKYSLIVSNVFFYPPIPTIQARYKDGYYIYPGSDPYNPSGSNSFMGAAIFGSLNYLINHKKYSK